MADPTCCECGKQPHEIQEYIDGAAEMDEMSPEDAPHTPLDYMLLEEGTYNSIQLQDEPLLLHYVLYQDRDAEHGHSERWVGGSVSQEGIKWNSNTYR